MSRVVVTGGAGFSGSHLVDGLIADGHQVLVIDDLSAGREELVNPAADLEVLDVSDAAALDPIVTGASPAAISWAGCSRAGSGSVVPAPSSRGVAQPPPAPFSPAPGGPAGTARSAISSWPTSSSHATRTTFGGCSPPAAVSAASAPVSREAV